MRAILSERSKLKDLSVVKKYWILLLIIFIGAFLRFYKLDWGQGLFTHPDEYHIVISVNQLSFPTQLNPHFFSYGTVTIYLIYFTEQFLNFTLSHLHTPNTFLLGRFFSALFSTLTLLLVYRISRSFSDRRFAIVATGLAALAPGLIQQAHFATPESALIFFILSSLLFLLNFVKDGKTTSLILAALFFGLSLGVKISSIVTLIPLLSGILLRQLSGSFKIGSFIKQTAIVVTISVVTFAASAPFVFLDFPSFLNSFNYESGVATGQLGVFYTRQFIETTPFLFQLEKILPFALGPALLVTGFIGFILIIFKIFQERPLNTHYIILAISFLSLLLPNSFLFAKWTRFIAPALPFFAFFAAFFLFKFQAFKTPQWLTLPLVFLLFAFHFFWAFSFFSIYTRPDIRASASQWLESSAPPGSVFLVEGGNTVDLPLSGNFRKISLDFYNLEESGESRQKIVEALTQADYFLVQSRRVFLNHQRLPGQFPKTAGLYNALFGGNLGFKETAEFASYPALSVLGRSLELADENAEETWSVFDHPVIRVFQKTKQLTKEEYTRLLGD